MKNFNSVNSLILISYVPPLEKPLCLLHYNYKKLKTPKTQLSNLQTPKFSDLSYDLRNLFQARTWPSSLSVVMDIALQASSMKETPGCKVQHHYLPLLRDIIRALLSNKRETGSRKNSISSSPIFYYVTLGG